MRPALALIAVLCIGCHQTSSPEAVAPADPLRATHDALFASFLPLEEFKGDPQLSKIFAAADDGLWTAASPAPAFRDLLKPFTNLLINLPHAVISIAAFIIAVKVDRRPASSTANAAA